MNKKDFTGWTFDWGKIEKNGFQILTLYAEDDERIQGAISFRPNRPNLTMEVEIIEAAPFNRTYKNKKIKVKEYDGVGGHLFAEVCRRSFELGFDGYVEFMAKTNLIDHYREKMGATSLGGQKMYIDTLAAKKLIERYYKK